MGCGRDIRADMLSLATFCLAINDKLVTFCDEGQSHADLWIRVKGAIKFLDLFSEQKQGPFDFFPKYGFRDNMSRLRYEQMVVTKNLLKEYEKRACETRKRLPLILDLRLDTEQRRKAAGYCIKLFSDLMIRYLWYFEFPPTFGMPRGLDEFLAEGSEKSKQVPRSKNTTKSGGKK